MSVKIFISGVSNEFGDYRDELRRDLTRHNVEVKIQEDFKDVGGVTLDKLDLYIHNCDAVIHLVGDMTGSEANPASAVAILAKYPAILERLPPLRESLEKGVAIAYTQWEAWLALYHGKALLIAQAGDRAPRGPNFAPTDTSRAAQKAHLERLKTIERHSGITFASRDDLTKQIAFTTILDLLAEDRRRGSADGRGIPYAAIIGALFIALLTPLAADQLTRMFGLTLGATASLIGGVGGLALALIYWRYVDILGSGTAPPGSLERQGYETLRATVVAGGWPVWLYTRWLTGFLDSIDRFFGDAGMADRTLFPRAFGLRTPAPLWTAPALDTCLLLAFIYPIVTIFIIWAISGHSGPAESVLALLPNLLGWDRGIVAAITGFGSLAVWRMFRSRGWRRWAWSIIVGVVFLLGIAVNFIIFEQDHGSVRMQIFNAFSLAVIVALIIGFARSGTVAVAAAISAAVSGVISLGIILALMAALVASGAVSLSDTFVVNALALAFVVAFLIALAAATLGIAFLVRAVSRLAMRRDRYGLFLLLGFPIFLVACLIPAASLSTAEGWANFSGPFLLFFGLLTLLNAPFDWISLGLTRALLRRGLELGGWWPYLLAIVDALLAAVIIAILALVMIVGVQAFDYLQMRGGGTPTLPLGPLLNGLDATPGEPEYWWIYALLLSTMIPSLVNLMIGGTALLRAAPGLPSLLLRKMPIGQAVPAFDRAWLALVLTLQVAGGVIAGVAAQALLAVALISYVMPWLRLGLLDLAYKVALFDLPATIGAMFGAGP